jgi:hypothetical protein
MPYFLGDQMADFPAEVMFSSRYAYYEIPFDPEKDKALPYTEIAIKIKSDFKVNVLYQVLFEYQTEKEARPFFILISTPYDPANIPLHEELSPAQKGFRKVVGWFAPERPVQQPVLQLRNWHGNGVFRIRNIAITEVGEHEAIFMKVSRNYVFYVLPGHYYSPIPSLQEIRDNEDQIFNRISPELPAIDLNTTNQLALLDTFKKEIPSIPFPKTKTDPYRYYYENWSFNYADAMVLYAMICHYRPRRIIEIGSGNSSCVTLDTNEFKFHNEIECTFIEPYPSFFLSLIKPGDRDRLKLIPSRLQDVPLSEFSALDENDILFIDSTHVSKINSDVNYIFFDIIPSLKKGVLVHFHDVFYPFEYPKPWAFEGRGWNEDYLLRAFLEFNSAFKIEFFNSYMANFYRDRIAEWQPDFLINTGGSIWLRKLT